MTPAELAVMERITARRAAADRLKEARRQLTAATRERDAARAALNAHPPEIELRKELVAVRATARKVVAA